MSKQPLERGLNFYEIHLLDPNSLCPPIPEMLLEESRREELFYEIVHLDQGNVDNGCRVGDPWSIAVRQLQAEGYDIHFHPGDENIHKISYAPPPPLTRSIVLGGGLKEYCVQWRAYTWRIAGYEVYTDERICI